MTSQEQPDLKPRIAEWQERLTNSTGGNVYEPGGLLASLLARVLNPSEIIFSDWTANEGSGFGLTSGSLFVLIPGFAVTVQWVNVPTGQDSSTGRERPSVDVVFHPLTEQPTVRLHIQNVYPESSSTDSGAVRLAGSGWSQALPFKARYRQATTDYFQEVWKSGRGSR